MITKLIRHSKMPRSINVDVLRCLNMVSHGNKWKHACKHITTGWSRRLQPVNKGWKLGTKSIYATYLHKQILFFFQQMTMFYPSRSSWISREAISLRASLGRQKLLISSSLRARAPLSTRAKLPWSKKGSRGPRESRAGPSICPSAWEEPCRAAERSRSSGIKGNSHFI